ncbi:hypothetical protein C1Y63_04125 [Corynebacterium sp. 13CS0277]|uniref:MMPL family transporter n=1 Tax=Corynebacterium sp. 13CS0277 TaxID=2071994 RepID=UPI000D040FBE|nr:MMPL family transporter [Corynebacterium sp. 13CS0277]PRQ11836.1 hypothetical protein C1Y63_04125 [Corynebacterium sp. 13CS0277]
MKKYDHKVSWLVIAAFLLGIAALFGLAPSGSDANSTAPQTLPTTSDSYRAGELAARFPGGDTLPAIVVYHRDAGIGADLAALQDLPQRAADALGATAGPVIPVNDTTAQATISLDGSLSGFGVTDAVTELRSSVKASAPEGVDAFITGPAGFAGDTAQAFKGANFTLLAVTALVVAVLLILTYRSPILWIVPLLVTGLADRAAAIVTTWLADATGWFSADGSTSGITSVLVFGAGTNYALLLVSRYREELHREADHSVALRRAWRASIRPIVSSNLTVVLALQTLWLASVPSLTNLGLSSSIGLLIALGFSLGLLPPLLDVCGRRLFWPRIPRVGEHTDAENIFGRVAARVNARPVAFLVPLLVVLLALGGGMWGTRLGLSTTEQFRTPSEAAEAAALLPAASPVLVYTPAGEIEQAVADATAVDGVTLVGQPQTSTDGQWQRATLIVDGDDPATVEAIREHTDAIVGGQIAQAMDNKAGTLRDMTVIVPLIFLAVFLVLMVVLRAWVAPLLLLAAAALSTWAAIGAGTFVSTHLFGFPGLDTSVPVYSILFLVALGIDYTVFLVLRAKEDTPRLGTRQAMVHAVNATGGVITSAGVVLAAVFAVLGVLPLITLTQVGILVGFGIILDTFLVRTLVVPALFALLGDRMWK